MQHKYLILCLLITSVYLTSGNNFHVSKADSQKSNDEKSEDDSQQQYHQIQEAQVCSDSRCHFAIWIVNMLFFVY